jgi:FMN-dependent NADH-azoreductase
MTTLLQVNASINNDNGQSTQLANQFVAAFRQRFSEARIVLRDVAAAEPVPHLNAERFGAFITKPEERSVTQHSVVAYSDALISELKEADVIVLDLPMYSFGVPSQLKAYFDHIARQ